MVKGPPEANPDSGAASGGLNYMTQLTDLIPIRYFSGTRLFH